MLVEIRKALLVKSERVGRAGGLQLSKQNQDQQSCQMFSCTTVQFQWFSMKDCFSTQIKK